jgi:UDPglucose 6-dehydrogenase
MKIAIIGAKGWVGSAMSKLFPEAYLYDLDLGTKIAVNKRDVAYICVPTPNNKSGTLDMSIVEGVVKWCECPLIIIRSTLQPGTADHLANKYDKNIVVQPEYIGEGVAHPLLDESRTPFMIIGGEPENRRKAIEVYQSVYNANIKIRQVTSYEAEVIKLSENRAIMYKIAQCQELYDACESSGVDYYTVRDAVYGDDPRFNLWWTFVYPDKRGANSPCIPKDVKAWASWAKYPKLTDALIDYNEGLIRG